MIEFLRRTFISGCKYVENGKLTPADMQNTVKPAQAGSYVLAEFTIKPGTKVKNQGGSNDIIHAYGLYYFTYQGYRCVTPETNCVLI